MDTVELHVHDGWEEVPCIPTPVPGLVLVHWADQYAVIHHRSGGAVYVTDSAERAAQFVLEAIEPLGYDWTLPAVEWEFRRQFVLADLSCRYGSQVTAYHAPATPEARAR